MFPSTVPPPRVMMLTDPPGQVVPVGGYMSISCTATLSPSVDTSMVVNTQWNIPSRGNVSFSSMVVPGMVYWSIQTWNSLDTTDAGNYTCSVTISSNGFQFTTQAAQTATTLGMLLSDILCVQRSYASSTFSFSVFNQHHNAAGQPNSWLHILTAMHGKSMGKHTHLPFGGVEELKWCCS